MDVFTSIALNYLPKARILASTVKFYHPEWKFHLLISDRRDEKVDFGAGELFDSINWVEDLNIKNIYQWIFKHTIIELCTAVKGPFALSLFRKGAKKIVYLDPDTAVFNRLDELDKILDHNPIVLTPHQLKHEETTAAIVDNEICSLKHGVFNLGFFAANDSEEGMKFVNWYSDRLLAFCYNDIGNGLFTDQKWCDLVPAFFPNVHILRDPGYNVASWNLSRRNLSFNQDGIILVNSSPLKFYHFTGYDSGMGCCMTTKYGGNNSILDEIWRWYNRKIKEHGQNELGMAKWGFDFFQNSQQIPKAARLLYRTRQELQERFPNPFLVNGNLCYYNWFKAQYKKNS